ncbi:Pyruvate kinase 2 [Nosema bombycis CQ1]|uniref:Pyruvate kinase n=2 Tax=Nosema bombycis TaxID=27978 RepID=R0KPT6_NOSB1|nr:Pyruvate kinase 2 [Nosema bombycis CQ1]|eukprot:EOB12207.1 Pyruvate kinase 2 [Nosema bombycis CQ1]
MFPTMTKIIVTVSSVSDDEETLTNFLKEGVHIFRINLSHGTSYQHEHSILNIRKCAKEMGIVPVICLDTRGPEVRIEIAERSEIPLKEGDKITFSNVRTSNKIFLPIPDFTKFPLKSKIYLDDAMLAIEVLETSKCECTGRAMNSHRLKNNKKASLPGLVFEDNESEARDKKDFEIILKHKIDVVFASFINSRKEVESLKK